jgi:hypothetical protein
MRLVVMDVRFREALGRLPKSLSSQGTAGVLEAGMLPKWRQCRIRFENLKNLPSDQRQEVDQVIRYMRVREESWLLIVDAVRKQDAAKLDKYRDQAKEADKLGKTLGL